MVRAEWRKKTWTIFTNTDIEYPTCVNNKYFVVLMRIRLLNLQIAQFLSYSVSDFLKKRKRNILTSIHYLELSCLIALNLDIIKSRILWELQNFTFKNFVGCINLFLCCESTVKAWT